MELDMALIQALVVFLQLLAASNAIYNTLNPSCKSKCGNVKIPYPFGTREGCHMLEHGDFRVFCDESSSPPKPTIPSNPPMEITKIDILQEIPCRGLKISIRSSASSVHKIPSSVLPYEKKNALINNKPFSASGASMLGFLLILSCAIFFLVRQRRKHVKQRKRAAELKAKLFKQNGGVALQELTSSTPGSAFKIFSEAKLVRATMGFKETHILGRGSHGVVFKGELDSRLIVAIKKSRAMNERESKEFAREMAILSQMNHVNVVKILGCCLDVEIPMLVYESIPGETLLSFIYSSGDDRSNRRGRYNEDLKREDHKDVKTSNVLLDGILGAKISDYGVSTMVTADKAAVATVVQRTCGYLGPEYLQTFQFTEKSDAYSFGVVLVEMITRRKPFQVEDEDDFKGLAASFVMWEKSGRLDEMLDHLLIRGTEKKKKIAEVAELACYCLNARGVERPSMKKVAVGLQTIEGSGDEISGLVCDSLREKESLRSGGISVFGYY
ncbi:putative wall-associated receptor kinase-like 16 [Wolffia australiana]